MNSTTEAYNSTTVDNIDKEEYLPPISLYICENGMIKYKPVHFEKDLIQYDLSVSQCKYPNGKYGKLRINVKIDGSKNVIRDRFEILDL